ncbi:metallophosphoesterase [Priestia filamentosa]|uniref:metallophosphoesterase n=1 Tax=Priestia filamentosa TaxID=1402861 RepID=UPI00397A9E55
MKLAVMTDIHLDVNSRMLKRDLYGELRDVLVEGDYDVLLITGDLSNSSQTTINILNKLREDIEKTILYIPGNHDVTKIKDDSWNSYNLLKEHESSLIDKPFLLGDSHIIIGDMGWYDYTFAPETINHKVIKERKKSLWDDAKYVKWGMDDIEVCDHMLEKLDKQLSQYSDRNIIFANHFIPYKDFIAYTSDMNWNLCNAFMGSSKLGELLDSYSNISHILFGHTHKRFGLIEDYGGKNIVCNPVGYLHEWGTNDVKKEFREGLTILEL